MDTIQQLRRLSISGSQFADEYLSHLFTLIEHLDREVFRAVIEEFSWARQSGNTIFIIGNGGSAATASHFAEDLLLGPKKFNNDPFRAIALTDSSAAITAIANDDGYDNSFLMQIETLFSPGDVVVGISASGNSRNVIRALDFANTNNGVTVGIVGFDGGRMKDVCKHTIHVETEKGNYEPVEDLHLIICHCISSYFKYQPERDS